MHTWGSDWRAIFWEGLWQRMVPGLLGGVAEASSCDTTSEAVDKSIKTELNLVQSITR